MPARARACVACVWLFNTRARGQATMVKHPVAAGWIAGTLEIGFTFPFEYVKTQLQLQQEASTLFAGTDRFRSSWHCTIATIRERGFFGLYRGGLAWAIFAGPRSATRFGTFEALSSISRQRNMPAQYGQSTMDTLNGSAAGIVEAALCQTPNQVLAIKMIHDTSPRGPKQYTGLAHCVQSIWRTDGLRGYFQGVGPATAKGAVTMAIRFTGYGQIKRLVQAGDDDTPLKPWQAMLAGGIAGAVSAVVSQPIDTVKANMMGLEAARFRSSFACAAELVRAGGVLTLFNGVGPRVIRVFIEVGLQFSLYESIGRSIDRFLDV